MDTTQILNEDIDSWETAMFLYNSALKEVGTKLDLVPEFDNPYDPNAVAIKYKGVHLGYVPRDKNSLIAQLLFFGHKDVVRCKVIQRDEKADPREQVRVKLYLKDKR